MTYTILILRRAPRELQHIPQQDYERVREAMHGLAHTPLARQALLEHVVEYVVGPTAA